MSAVRGEHLLSLLGEIGAGEELLKGSNSCVCWGRLGLVRAVKGEQLLRLLGETGAGKSC